MVDSLHALLCSSKIEEFKRFMRSHFTNERSYVKHINSRKLYLVSTYNNIDVLIY